MKNICNRKDMWLVANKNKYLKLAMKPNFKDGRKFTENVIGVEMGKIKIKIVKSKYLVQAALGLSKLLVYESHYDYIVPKYGLKLQLCYMYTDSFLYHIKMHHF